MSFDSVIFISCFLPAVLLFYWLIPGLKGKNTLLLVFSLLFYSFAGFSSLLLLVGFAILNYLLGLLLRKNRLTKVFVVTGVFLNIAFLGVFKYLSFILNALFRLPEVTLGIAVPLGISFFTFKSVSYLIDVYRDRETAANSFWDYLLYVSFFPQIVTGPITRFVDFAPQLNHRVHSLDAATAGVRRFVAGLGKKLILSGTLGTMVDGIFALPAGVLDVRLAWLGAIGYCLQLYFDFSGYVDMAIGLGNVFGFSAIENFNHPYISCSIGEFWRRWHISLSSWFKDYVYIPLGGNRKGGLRTGINKWIVFLLCGIWHGASWTFLVWGIWHGIFSMLESTGIIPVKKLKKVPFAGHLCTLLVVCIGFVMFRSQTAGQGISMINAMLTGFSFTAAGTVALRYYVTAEAVVVLVLGVILSLPVKEYLSRIPLLSKHWEVLSSISCVLLFVCSIIALAAGGFAPSIYAGF